MNDPSIGLTIRSLPGNMAGLRALLPRPAWPSSSLKDNMLDERLSAFNEGLINMLSCHIWFDLTVIGVNTLPHWLKTFYEEFYIHYNLPKSLSDVRVTSESEDVVMDVNLRRRAAMYCWCRFCNKA